MEISLPKRCLMAVLLGAVLVIICIAFIDRPVERFFAAHAAFRPIFQLMCVPSLLPLPAACIYLASRTFRLTPLAAPSAWPWLQLSIATIAATAAKDELKWIFGRSWPEYLIQYNVYDFRPFNTGFLYGGFPSGHTAYITAPMLVLWWSVPRLRWLWAAAMGAVMAGLVGGGYHYVGDVVAGFFLGLAAATGTLIWLGPRNAG
jgi:membrane-associated phospholipid phosphatase